MDKLAAMKTFVRVVELGTFSAAAQERNVSRSAITKQIATLESELGLKLLERTTRSLALTAAGELYFYRSRQLVQEVADIETAARLRHGSASR